MVVKYCVVLVILVASIVTAIDDNAALSSVEASFAQAMRTTAADIGNDGGAEMLGEEKGRGAAVQAFASTVRLLLKEKGGGAGMNRLFDRLTSQVKGSACAKGGSTANKRGSRSKDKVNGWLHRVVWQQGSKAVEASISAMHTILVGLSNLL